MIDNTKYFPWATSQFSSAATAFDRGQIPALDIELTGKCRHGACIYCDSKVNLPEIEPSWDFIKSMVTEAAVKGLQWLYLCGLGDPLDSRHFSQLIELAVSKHVRINLFTNGLGLTRETALMLKESDSSILLKLDSFNSRRFDVLLGRQTTAEKIYAILEMLLEIDFANPRLLGNELVTNLGLSIVPTQINYGDIGEVVSFAKHQRLFPSIGELEYANKGRRGYSSLSLSQEELDGLKKEISGILGNEYSRPPCPATLFSLHFDVQGNCLVDKPTGLSCPWFRLGEPQLMSLGNIREFNLVDIYKRLIEYRVHHAHGVRTLCAHPMVPNTFSGCGGNVHELQTIAARYMIPEEVRDSLRESSIAVAFLQNRNLLLVPVDHPLGEDTKQLAMIGIRPFVRSIDSCKHDGYIFHVREFELEKFPTSKPFFLTVGEQPEGFLYPLEKLRELSGIKQVAIYYQVRSSTDNEAIRFYSDYANELRKAGFLLLGMGFPPHGQACDYYQHIVDIAHTLGCDYVKTAMHDKVNDLELHGMALFIGGGHLVTERSFSSFLRRIKRLPHANLSIGRNVFEASSPHERIHAIERLFRDQMSSNRVPLRSC